MWKVFNFEQHMALDRNFINKRGATLLSFFFNFIKEIPSTLQERVRFHSLAYLKSQLLDSMGSLSNFSSQEQGESQGIKSMHVYQEVHGVHRRIGKVHRV